MSVAQVRQRIGPRERIETLKKRANDLYDAMMCIANKMFDDYELEDTCREVDIRDMQFWLMPPPMPETSNITQVLNAASRAGWCVRRELGGQIRVLDQQTVAFVIDGLATIIQDLQNADNAWIRAQYLARFYGVVIAGYEKALEPLLRKADEQGLLWDHDI